ncbi:MAG: prolipoprotein diacylglyceryl transferase [Candidatus Omnitrophica bacterium]|nr:prolipoprotein diacylglyceryl transferase [Candidatus Omnitrophota bacterium]
MYPVLFKLGPVKIFSYGFMVALGFLLATIFAERDAKRYNISSNLITDLAIIIILSGLLGARIFYAICNIDYFVKNPKEIFMLMHGGLIFYGGAFFSFFASLVFLRIKKISFLKVADFVIPYTTLAYSIGRIGCFLNGCCWGKPTHFFLGVIFPGSAEALHPTQIYEAISSFFLFIFLILIRKRKKFDGQVFLIWCIFYGIIRFLIEFLRGDNRPVLFGLTFSQIVSVLIFFIGILFYCYPVRESRQS